MRNAYLVMYGGLGNQLFQCSAALSLGDDYYVSVFSDWGFARKSENGKLDVEQFNWEEELNFVPTPKIGKLSKKALNLLLRLGSEERKNLSSIYKMFLSPYFSLVLRAPISIHISQGLGFSRIPKRKNLLLVGYFQSFRYFHFCQTELMNITPKKISSGALEMLKAIRSLRTLIIHVRRGDYLQEKFGLLENSYYSTAIESLDILAYDQVWIFSDDIVAAKEVECLNLIPNVKFMDDTQLTNAETMEIMRHGAGFIIANSSFSWWAAQLRYDRKAPVICPSPWFKYTQSPLEILEESWMKVTW